MDEAVELELVPGELTRRRQRIDRRGLIPDADAARLREFGQRIADTYRTDLARRARARSTAFRGSADRFAAARVNDGDATTYWATDDGVAAGTIDLEWQAPVTFDRVVLQEAIALGQRVQGWRILANTGDQWTPIASGTTIGRKRIAKVPATTTSRLRVEITSARACPTISAISVFDGRVR